MVESASPADEGPVGVAGQLQLVQGPWEQIVRLFARASPLSMSHWNPATGERFELPRGKQRAATAARFEQRLFADARWVEVPCQESDQGYRMAQAFAAELRPGRARQLLVEALATTKPFRAFRAVLVAHPGLQRRWQVQVDAEAELRLVEFCLSQGWSLPDPRFEEVLERWLDLTEGTEEGELAAHGRPPGIQRRSVGSLSLGRGPHVHGEEGCADHDRESDHRIPEGG